MTAMLPRRDFLKVTAALSVGLAMTAPVAAAVARTGALVPISDFPGVSDLTYLAAARKHPLSIPVAKAMSDYVEMCTRIADGGGAVSGAADDRVLAAFARLINADPFEVSFVASTMAAENAIVAALGLPETGGNIVTDDLHYGGSMYLYQCLARRGVEVRQIRHHGGAVTTAEIVAAIDGKTKLVAVSLVSSTNGFRHDLEPICAAAHAKGSLVYADIIQAAGAMPIDVRASNVDLCAAGTHKWLMGDKGLGFIYVRRDLLESGRIRGAQHGWKQGGLDYRVFDDRKDAPLVSALPLHPHPGAIGQFEVGTYGLAPMMGVGAGLAYIERIGVANIHAHAMPFAERLRSTLPRLGYPCLTPPSSAPYISSFKVADPAATQARLIKAGVQATLEQNFMRVSTSVYTTMDDIAKIEAALT